MGTEHLYSKGLNDECYTPRYAIWPLLDFIPEGAIVWCPFDTKKSKFVQEISLYNEVIYSHCSVKGQNFYHYEPDKWDILISNPPFSGKREIFERALSFDKPFALLMTVTWLNDSGPAQLFKGKDLQLLMFDKRIHYENRNTNNGSPTFSSAYFCWSFLPKQIIIKELRR
jgi:hypothetical protein